MLGIDLRKTACVSLYSINAFYHRQEGFTTRYELKLCNAVGVNFSL